MELGTNIAMQANLMLLPPNFQNILNSFPENVLSHPFLRNSKMKGFLEKWFRWLIIVCTLILYQPSRKGAAAVSI